MFPYLRGGAHAQKCAVLSINSGHAVALPAAPHFIVVLRWKDSCCWTPATLLAAPFRKNFCLFVLSPPPPSPRESRCRNCECVAGRGGLWMWVALCHAGPATMAPSPPRLRIQLRGHAAPSWPVRLPSCADGRQIARRGLLFGRADGSGRARVGLGAEARQTGPLSLSSSRSGAPRTRGRIHPVHWPCSLLCFKLDFRGNGDLFSRSGALELSFS